MSNFSRSTFEIFLPPEAHWQPQAHGDRSFKYVGPNPDTAAPIFKPETPVASVFKLFRPQDQKSMQGIGWQEHCKFDDQRLNFYTSILSSGVEMPFTILATDMGAFVEALLVNMGKETNTEVRKHMMKLALLRVNLHPTTRGVLDDMARTDDNASDVYDILCDRLNRTPKNTPGERDLVHLGLSLMNFDSDFNHPAIFKALTTRMAGYVDMLPFNPAKVSIGHLESAIDRLRKTVHEQPLLISTEYISLQTGLLELENLRIPRQRVKLLDDRRQEALTAAKNFNEMAEKARAGAAREVADCALLIRKHNRFRTILEIFGDPSMAILSRIHKQKKLPAPQLNHVWEALCVALELDKITPGAQQEFTYGNPFDLPSLASPGVSASIPQPAARQPLTGRPPQPR